MKIMLCSFKSCCFEMTKYLSGVVKLLPRFWVLVHSIHSVRGYQIHLDGTLNNFLKINLHGPCQFIYTVKSGSTFTEERFILRTYSQTCPNNLANTMVGTMIGSLVPQ